MHSSTCAVRYVKRIRTSPNGSRCAAINTEDHAAPSRSRRPGPRATLLTTCRRGPQIGQHDHPHQLTERLVSGRGSPRATRAYTIPNAAPTRPSAVNGEQPAARALSPRAPSITPARRAKTSSRRARIWGRPAGNAPHTPAPAPAHDQRTQNHREAATHPLTPPKTLQTRPREPPLQHPEDIVEQRSQTLLAVLEQLVERAPRHPRTLGDLRHRRTRVTQLLQRRDRTRQQPRALNLHQTPLRRRQPPGTCARRRAPSDTPDTDTSRDQNDATQSAPAGRLRGPRAHLHHPPHAIENPRSPKGEPGRRESAKRRGFGVRPPSARERERERDASGS